MLKTLFAAGTLTLAAACLTPHLPMTISWSAAFRSPAMAKCAWRLILPSSPWA